MSRAASSPFRGRAARPLVSAPLPRHPRRRKALLASLLAIGVVAAGGCATSAPPGNDTLDGEAVYTRYCAVCHGPEGNGQGPAAYLLFPKPRNFVRAEFKLRSTPMGMLPTDSDLVRTVSNGIPSTPMFGFGEFLEEAEIDAVVEYVKSLVPAFEGAVAATPDDLLQIPSPPPVSAELIATGRQTYEIFRCAMCHGPEGKGDGPAAPGLRDSEGAPFPAADFNYGLYKSGGRPEDLYRTFLTGMAGTPMPSYADAIETEEQAWGLVYYVLSMSPGGQAQPTAGDPGPVRAVATDDDSLLTDPLAAGWDDVRAHSVYLRPLWFRSDYPLFATVRAAVVDQRIAFLLEWEDAARDAGAQRTQDFSDAGALQFALADTPPFLMGQPGPGNDVEIWYWRAERQLASESDTAAGFAAAYPNLVTDRSPDSADYRTGSDAGNPVSSQELTARPVHSMAAAGYGSLTTRPADRMRADGAGVWSEGVYRVVFSSPLLPTDGALEADFTGPRVPFAVALWDGGAGDRNGTKLVSQWLMLELPSSDR